MPTKTQLEKMLGHSNATIEGLRKELKELKGRLPWRCELDGILFEDEGGNMHVSVRQDDDDLPWTKLVMDSGEVEDTHEFLGNWLVEADR